MLVSTIEIDVRYAETDQMGVVYHANYLVWMEVGRTNLIKDMGFNYAEVEKDGIISPVLDVQVSYKKPFRYGETATVQTWIEEYDGIKITYRYHILNAAGDVCVTGESKHVCVKKDSFRPLSIKRKYPDWHEAYEKAKKHPTES